MHFAAGDRLRLARRIVSQFPVPGAANIGVRDLLFRTGDNQHHYVFTVDYTVGVIRGKIGKSRVAGFTEPVVAGGGPIPSSRRSSWPRQISPEPPPTSISSKACISRRLSDRKTQATAPLWCKTALSFFPAAV